PHNGSCSFCPSRPQQRPQERCEITKSPLPHQVARCSSRYPNTRPCHSDYDIDERTYCMCLFRHSEPVGELEMLAVGRKCSSNCIWMDRWMNGWIEEWMNR